VAAVGLNTLLLLAAVAQILVKLAVVVLGVTGLRFLEKIPAGVRLLNPRYLFCPEQATPLP
jgi:hypothetical protein